MRIVGSITDENELDELQNIAKVVIYEQRMKGFKYPPKANNHIQKNFRGENNHHKIDTVFSSYGWIRGLF